MVQRRDADPEGTLTVSRHMLCADSHSPSPGEGTESAGP